MGTARGRRRQQWLYTAWGAETGLVLEIKNLSETDRYVCPVTHSPIVTKPLAVRMHLHCREEGRPQFSGASERSPADLSSPKSWKGIEQRARAREVDTRKLPGPGPLSVDKTSQSSHQGVNQDPTLWT